MMGSVMGSSTENQHHNRRIMILLITYCIFSWILLFGVELEELHQMDTGKLTNEKSTFHTPSESRWALALIIILFPLILPALIGMKARQVMDKLS